MKRYIPLIALALTLCACAEKSADTQVTSGSPDTVQTTADTAAISQADTAASAATEPLSTEDSGSIATEETEDPYSGNTVEIAAADTTARLGQGVYLISTPNYTVDDGLRDCIIIRDDTRGSYYQFVDEEQGFSDDFTYTCDNGVLELTFDFSKETNGFDLWEQDGVIHGRHTYAENPYQNFVFALQEGLDPASYTPFEEPAPIFERGVYAVYEGDNDAPSEYYVFTDEQNGRIVRPDGTALTFECRQFEDSAVYIIEGADEDIVHQYTPNEDDTISMSLVKGDDIESGLIHPFEGDPDSFTLG
ncbi:MAG: hypothetical protein J6M90_07930 [Oscillospiraceae bacterium]|nr:hypothetical protein [Oscillospiraceae bacterium]